MPGMNREWRSDDDDDDDGGGGGGGGERMIPLT